MKNDCELTLGIDIGSTTAKIVVVDKGTILFEKYQRHFSQVRQKTLELLDEAAPYVGTAPLPPPSPVPPGWAWRRARG